jgi:alkylation response protein AidB-like acyl-CoA dehydrogenase
MKPVLLAVAAALAAVALPPAGAQTIYKYVSPNGRVTYSQTPVPGARLVEELAPAPQVSPATLEANRARRAARDKALNDAANRRIQSLDQASNELNVWSGRLRDAQVQLEAGREPLPGERTGVVFQGKSRLNEAYWARQATNEAAVAEAEAHVDHARATIQALR